MDTEQGFLKFIGENYTSYVHGKNLTFMEDDFKSSNLKKILTKTCIHFHPDKSAKAKQDGMSEGQIYLRNEILKILTSFINALKGHQEPVDTKDDVNEEMNNKEEAKQSLKEQDIDPTPIKLCGKNLQIL